MRGVKVYIGMKRYIVTARLELAEGLVQKTENKD